MIKGWDLTIYELLGYLVPGVLASAGLLMLAGLEHPAWVDPSRWTNLGWRITLPLVVAYMLGHLVQAVANLAFGNRFENAALDELLGEIPASSFEAVTRRLSMPDPAAAAARLKAVPRFFLALCTEILNQDGKPAMRDVFLYREGFYRGTCIALVVVAAGLMAFGLKLAKPDESVVPRVAAVLSLLAAIAFLLRYRRFARYRISSCLWGAVTLVTGTRSP